VGEEILEQRHEHLDLTIRPISLNKQPYPVS